jgi:galactose mutarotase-like enzyme
MKSNKVSLKSRKNNKSVTVDYTGFQYLALWGKGIDVNMVCIEPWFGIADTVDSTGDITKKRGIRELEVNDIFKCLYSIEIQ